MENSLGNVLFEEKITKSSSPAGGEGDDHVSDEEINKGENQRQIKQEEDSSKPLSPNKKDSSSNIIKEREEIESAKAKMGEVKEENRRLKLLLSQIVKDYQSLQMRFLDILQQDQEEAKKSSTQTSDPSHDHEEEYSDIRHHHHHLVSLSLGRSSTSGSTHEAKKEEKKICIEAGGLALGLDCKFEPAAAAGSADEKNPSSESSLGKPPEEEPAEMWPPSKIMKTALIRSGRDNNEDVSEQMNSKKARVSVRARCDTPTMNDGCQWRKYGQKIAKANPCPRAYYRCTVSPTCPVRKQVQRCAEDMSILITTYEGNHNHPLPLTATAMASTTSAAASMLQSESSTSVSAANLHNPINFNFSHHSRPPYHQQFYFPNSSISTSNSHPTITLDLTSPTNSSYFSRLCNKPRFSSSTSLNFSSSSSSLSYPQTSACHLSFGAFTNQKNSSFIGPFSNNSVARQAAQESDGQCLSETIAAAATKAIITSNPNFHSALTAALMNSFVGLSRENNTMHAALENNKDVGCESSNLEKSNVSMNSQQQQNQSLVLFPATSKISTPPADHKSA